MAVVYSPEGKRRQYGYVWTKIRGIILERDASFHGGVSTCEHCGAVDGELAYTGEGRNRRAIWKRNEDGTRTRVRVIMEVDHILPFCLGGEEMNPDNCVTMCRQCNRRFADKRKDPETEYRLLLLAYERNRAILEGKA